VTGPKLARAESDWQHRIPTLSDFLSRRLARVATSRPLIYRGILTGVPLRNAWVGGSNPSCGTNEIKGLQNHVAKGLNY
jgi:hypothetical protein